MKIRRIVLASACCCLVGVGSANEIARSVSPDGKNVIRLFADPLAYEVSREGHVLVARTEIGLSVDGALLPSGETVHVSTDVRSGWLKPVFYKKERVANDGRGTFADFGTWGVRLIARDDGVAYRYETRLPGRISVTGELAGLTLSPETETYVNFNVNEWGGDPFQNSSESVTERMPAARISTSAKRIAYLPLAFRGDGGTAVCVTESELVDYPGMNLRVGQSETNVLLRAAFAGFPRVAVYEDQDETNAVRRLRAQRVLSREDYLVRTDGTRTFPWRCFLIARDFSRLVENDLVWALASPSRVADTSWIRPGKVAWEWWNAMDNQGERTGCNTRTYERFIDFASRNGVEYVIFDEGWSENLNIWKCSREVDVPHLIRYANARGVGIILWMAWAQVLGDEERVAAHFAKMGAKGFKVDFMDRDDAACVNFLWKFADACARERMLVDYHGMFKPTGMERTYPNVLNFEGVHGLEQMKWYDSYPVERWNILTSDVRGYFVRMSVGPMDYTPGAMDNYPVGSRNLYKGTYENPGSLGTRCRQLAMMVLYYAPLQMLCDSPTKYEKNMETFRFMAETPVAWDETIGLPGDPDGFCSCARRRGNVWYAAGMTDAGSRDVVLDTFFLGTGRWRAEEFRDAADSDGNPTHYEHRSGLEVKPGDRMPFHLSKGGGFVLRFEQVTERN